MHKGTAPGATLVSDSSLAISSLSPSLETHLFYALHGYQQKNVFRRPGIAVCDCQKARYRETEEGCGRSGI